MWSWYNQSLTEIGTLHLYIHISRQYCAQWQKLHSGTFIERPMLPIYNIYTCLHIFCTYKIALIKTTSSFTDSKYTKVQIGGNAKVLCSQTFNCYLTRNQSSKPEHCKTKRTASHYEYLALCVVSARTSRTKVVNVSEFPNYYL